MGNNEQQRVNLNHNDQNNDKCTTMSYNKLQLQN